MRSALLSVFLLIAGTGATAAAELELVPRVAYAAAAVQPGITRVDVRRTFSEDGRFFVFTSAATALVPGVLDLNGELDVFLADRQSGSLELISFAAASRRLAGRGGAADPRLSADGRYVFFTSNAPDLTFPATAGYQVFRHDRQTGITRLVSHRAGQPGAAISSAETRLADISADGRYAAVYSSAPAAQLVPGANDNNTGQDLFSWDAVEDGFQLASYKIGLPLETPSQEANYYGSLVADDGRIAFRASRQLALPGESAAGQVYVFDPATGANLLVSASTVPGAASNDHALEICDFSAGGRYLLFRSIATDLVAGQVDAPPATGDLFLFDGEDGDGEGNGGEGAVELVTAKPGQPAAAGNGDSFCGSLSQDGRWVFFATEASDLVAGVSGSGGLDLLRRDRQTGVTVLVTADWQAPSVATGGVALWMDLYTEAVRPLSAHGGSFLFAATAPSLAPGDKAGAGPWSYRWDNLSETVELAAPAPSGGEAALPGQPRAIAADGSAALYLLARPYGRPASPANDTPQLVLREELSGALSLPARAAYAGRGSISGWADPFTEGQNQGPGIQLSGDGSRVAFVWGGPYDHCGRGASLCLLERASGELRNLMHGARGPGSPAAGVIDPLGFTQDGRHLLVQSRAPEHAEADTNGELDLFIYDIENSSWETLSHAAGSPGTTADRGILSLLGPGAMTPDGRRVVFNSRSTNLVAGATTGDDVFLADRATGTTVLVSSRHDNPLAGGAGSSLWAQISADGNYVIFHSRAADLIEGFLDTNGPFPSDLYIRDLAAGTTALVSHVEFNPRRGGRQAEAAQISASGRYVAHTNSSPVLVTGGTDTNNWYDLFRYDRTTGVNTLISHTAADPLVATGGTCRLSGMSADGRFVLMICSGTDLVPGTPANQLYLWDGDDGSIRLVSHRPGESGTAIGAPVGKAVISTGGDRVFYITAATDVVPGQIDTPETADVFVWERSTGKTELLTHRFGRSNEAAGVDCVFFPTLFPSATSGRHLVLGCRGSALVPFDNNPFWDYFVVSLPTPLFADGFESGATDRWNLTP